MNDLNIFTTTILPAETQFYQDQKPLQLLLHKDLDLQLFSIPVLRILGYFQDH